jgi:hypothetical protein
LEAVWLVGRQLGSDAFGLVRSTAECTGVQAYGRFPIWKTMRLFVFLSNGYLQLHNFRQFQDLCMLLTRCRLPRAATGLCPSSLPLDIGSRSRSMPRTAAGSIIPYESCVPAASPSSCFVRGHCLVVSSLSTAGSWNGNGRSLPVFRTLIFLGGAAFIIGSRVTQLYRREAFRPLLLTSDFYLPCGRCLFALAIASITTGRFPQGLLLCSCFFPPSSLHPSCFPLPLCCSRSQGSPCRGQLLNKRCPCHCNSGYHFGFEADRQRPEGTCSVRA